MVGGEGCGQVEIKDLELLWNATLNVTVVYEPCFDAGREAPVLWMHNATPGSRP